MDDVVNLLVNNGVAVAVILYFMYRDYKFQETLQRTLQTLVDTVEALHDMLYKEV
jgi:hypothetical protein